MQGRVSGGATLLGEHAAQLGGESPASSSDAGHRVAAHTDFAWREPVSPHIAVLNEGESG